MEHGESRTARRNSLLQRLLPEIRNKLLDTFDEILDMIYDEERRDPGIFTRSHYRSPSPVAYDREVRTESERSSHRESDRVRDGSPTPTGSRTSAYYDTIHRDRPSTYRDSPYSLDRRCDVRESVSDVVDLRDHRYADRLDERAISARYDNSMEPAYEDYVWSPPMDDVSYYDTAAAEEVPGGKPRRIKNAAYYERQRRRNVTRRLRVTQRLQDTKRATQLSEVRKKKRKTPRTELIPNRD